MLAGDFGYVKLLDSSVVKLALVEYIFMLAFVLSLQTGIKAQQATVLLSQTSTVILQKNPLYLHSKKLQSTI